jgi:Phage portal protein
MGWSLHSYPIEKAVGEGLVERINAKSGRNESREAFLKRLRAECIDEEQWLQEYRCIPSDVNTAFLSFELLCACEDNSINLMNLDQFLKFARSNPQFEFFLGLDLARSKNLCVIDVGQKIGDLVWDRLRIELSDIWVYRAINVLAEQIANIPFLFSRGERGRENLITSGPLHDFYNRPHPHINRFQYWELRIIWLMLRGESIRIPIFDDPSALNHNLDLDPPPLVPFGQRGLSFCAPHPSFCTTAEHSLRNTQYALSTAAADGRTTNHESRSTLHAPRSTLRKVLILDPALFHHIIQDNELVGWRYTGGGPNTPLLSQVFLPEEIWFEKLPNPFDFWRGLSPLAVAATATRSDFAAGSFMNGLIENNADLGLIVRTDQQLSEQQRAQVVAELRSRKRRAGTPDRPILLCGGAQIDRPQLSSAELQFLEN